MDGDAWKSPQVPDLKRRHEIKLANGQYMYLKCAAFSERADIVCFAGGDAQGQCNDELAEFVALRWGVIAITDARGKRLPLNKTTVSLPPRPMSERWSLELADASVCDLLDATQRREAIQFVLYGAEYRENEETLRSERERLRRLMRGEWF